MHESQNSSPDPIAYHQWLVFENKRLNASGEEFQKLFEDIMVRAKSGFIRIRPYGNIGDRKCDGLFRLDSTFYQVYSPDELKQADLQKKIDEDLDGAIQNWEKELKKWIFVYNVKRGLPPNIPSILTNKQRQYPNIIIDHLSNDDLWSLASNLHVQKRTELFGAPTLISNLVESQEKLDEELNLSKARCISRYLALGLNKNDAKDLFEILKVDILSNVYTSSESLTLLIGEMGTGKSLIAELLLQQAIEKAQKDKDAPYPIYLTIECIKESKSLKKAISDSAEGICDIKKQKILVVIDSPDELGMSFANKQLEDARTLVSAWNNLTIVITSRPIPSYENAEEAKKIPLLSSQESVDLVCQVAKHHDFSLSSQVPNSVKDAIRRPLFAILLGVYFKDNQDTIPFSKEQLLEYLVRRSLEPLIQNDILVEEVNKLLQNLAIESINNGGLGVPASYIATLAERKQLLETRLVVEQEGKLKFPLPVLTQWFAAQSLNSGQVNLQTLVANPEKLELWQYPLVIAVSIFNPNVVLNILKPVVENHPVLGAEIIREAFPNQSYFINAKQLPVAVEVGQQVITSMKTWVKGLSLLGNLIAPIDKTGSLVDIGVRVYQKPRFKGILTLSDQTLMQTDDVIAYADIAWSDQASENPLSVLSNNFNVSECRNTNWRKIQSFELPNSGSWNWSWTRKELIKSLAEILQRRGIPATNLEREYHFGWRVQPPLTTRMRPQAAPTLKEPIYQYPKTNSVLALEGAWYAAVCLTQRYSNQNIDLTPIPLAEIESLISQVKDYSTLLGRGVDPLRLNQLIIEIEFLRGLNEKHLFYPWINRYSKDPERILIHATDIYKAALDAYEKLIHQWFPKFIPWLETASRFPVCIKGVVSTQRTEKYGSGLSWQWNVLPIGNSNTVDFKFSNSLVDSDDLGITEAFRNLEMRPEVSSKNKTITSHFGDPTMFNWTPVTDLVYGWLWQDLQKINWVEGGLGNYGLFSSPR